MIFFCICLVLLVSCTTETVMVDEEEIAQEVSVEVLPENEEVNSDETLTEVGETEIENEVDSPVLEKETTLEAEEAIEEVTPEVDPNLVLHLDFEETLEDSTGNYEAEAFGGARFTNGVVGSALFFDGVDDYVSFSDAAVEEIGSLDEGTIAFWLNYESILNTQPVMPIFYLGIEDGPDLEDNMYIIEIGHGNFEGANNRKLYSTWIKDNEEPFLCSDSSVDIAEGEWVHFAVASGPEGNTLYMNGEEIGARDYNFGHPTGDSFLSDIPVRDFMTLGYGRSSFMLSPDFVYYKGLLDDFRVYDRALNSDEVFELADLE